VGNHEYGPLRSNASRKPWPIYPDIVFQRCSKCGGVYQELSGAREESRLYCCAQPADRLRALAHDEAAADFKISYRIVGGYNQSAVHVLWKTTNKLDDPEWILLKTFTGGYLKYVPPEKHPPIVFPLADEDAYVYCDRQTCQQCVFCCKKGFVIYVYVRSMGLLQTPLDQKADYFHTSEPSSK